MAAVIVCTCSAPHFTLTGRGVKARWATWLDRPRGAVAVFVFADRGGVGRDELAARIVGHQNPIFAESGCEAEVHSTLLTGCQYQNRIRRKLRIRGLTWTLHSTYHGDGLRGAVDDREVGAVFSDRGFAAANRADAGDERRSHDKS